MKANRDSVMTPLPAWLRACTGGFSIEVHVQPGARRSQVLGIHGDRLKVAVLAPPTDGRANAAVIQLIAERLDCRPSAVRVAAGACSRDKRLRIADGSLTASDIIARLQPK